ncbi:hypothetical protein PV326_001638, partial [Microctonus aethiopoides]
DKIRTRGGGTAIVIKKEIIYSEIQYPTSKDNKILEYSIAKINLKGNKSLFVVAVYASNSIATKELFLSELSHLFEKLKLHDNKNFYLIAGDFNARHTELGDRASNRRGKYLLEWNKHHTSQYRTKIYPPDAPTYIPAQTFLDLCIADFRMEMNKTTFSQDTLPTIDYDSDHKAILMTLLYNDLSIEMNNNPPGNENFRPYKKINWKKFGKLLIDAHNDTSCPHNRNLTKDEIDHHIEVLSRDINTTLDKLVTSNNSKPNKFTIMNRKILKLHKIKSKLLTKLNKQRRFDPTVRLQPTAITKSELLM